LKLRLFKPTHAQAVLNDHIARRKRIWPAQATHGNVLGCPIAFCSRLEVLPYGAKAAQHYGVIRAALEKLGQPIV
jgi:hypothetical protein